MAKLSIIVPCYNEEKGLPNLFGKLDYALSKLRKNYSVEIIFVDDGSTDRTNELLHEHYGKDAVIIRHDRNRNLGAAMKTGFKRASGDFIAALDSDCAYHPDLISEMMGMMGKDADIVTVSPYHPEGRVNNVPGYRLFLSKSISRIYQLLLDSGIWTYTAMVRVYRKNIVKNVKFESDTFLGVTEIMIKSILAGYKVKELPAELNVRKYGVSKMKILSVISGHVGLIARILAYKLFGGRI
jgi:dolichol-phosphate mannosyltransferase